MAAPEKSPPTVATVEGAKTYKRKTIVALYQRALCAINYTSVVLLGELVAVVVFVLLLVGGATR